MKTSNKNLKKKSYLSPEIFAIRLDHEISLALASAPPEGPDESFSQNEYFNNSPEKKSFC